MSEMTRVLCELDSLESIAFMVEQGLGRAVLPSWPGLNERHPNLTAEPVTAGANQRRESVFLDRKTTPPNSLSKLASESFPPSDDGLARSSTRGAVS